MFSGTKTRGRKVGGKLNLNQEDQLVRAIYEAAGNAKE